MGWSSGVQEDARDLLKTIELEIRQNRRCRIYLTGMGLLYCLQEMMVQMLQMKNPMGPRARLIHQVRVASLLLSISSTSEHIHHWELEVIPHP